MARRDIGVTRALLDVCRARPPRIPRDPDVVTEFVEGVRLHRIAPLAHVLVRDDRPEVAQILAPDRERALATHLAACMVVGALAELLGGIRWAVFKGPVLSERAHPVPGLRTYGDVDVLVDPGDLREVTSRLRRAGWTVGDPRTHHRNPDTPGEMHWRTPTGLYVDLHWSMVNMASVRRRTAIPTADLLQRTVTAHLGVALAPVLDEVDAFVHVCHHAGRSGAHRLLWLVDIDQLVAAKPDWDAVVERASDWQVAAHVAVALRRARRFLDTPVPAGVEERLGVQSGSLRLLDLADRASPVPRLVQEESLAKLVARGMHGRTAATARAITRKAALYGWGRIRGPQEHSREEFPADEQDTLGYVASVEAEAGRTSSP